MLRLRKPNPRSQPCPPYQAGSKVYRRSFCREISQEIDLAKTNQGIFQVIITIRIYRNISILIFPELSGVCPQESPEWKVQSCYFLLKLKLNCYSPSPGMEGHARAADVRLEKYFPGETFDLHPARNFITEQ